MNQHRDAAYRIDDKLVPEDMLDAALVGWDEVVALGQKSGFRNSQLSVLAPTGTIAFMMDCDTTGVEPDIALIKYKRLVGGGYLKIVNQTVPHALKALGYTADQTDEIVAFIDAHETIEGAPHLTDEHLDVFDCAFKPANGNRSIHYNGHLKMMAAVQPFISGAISKTVNMPEASTPEEIAQVYVDGWKLGLKAIAVYRDNSKRSQPLNTKKDDGKGNVADAVAPEVQTVYKPLRRRLPDERASITHKFNVGGHEGYLTIGLYEDGTPGEIFLRMAKEGSTICGLMDSFATAISLALQYGVPLKDLVNKFSHLRFEPAGFTGNRDIPMAKSLVDYVFRYMATKFMSQAEKDGVGIINRQLTLSDAKVVSGEASGDAPTASRSASSASAPPPAAATRTDSGPTRSAEGGEATTGPLIRRHQRWRGTQGCGRAGHSGHREHSGWERCAGEGPGGPGCRVGGAEPRAAGRAEDRGAERRVEGSGGAARASARRRSCSTPRTRRPAPTAARSWSATAPATSASTAAPPAAAANTSRTRGRAATRPPLQKPSTAWAREPTNPSRL